ncbi:MAG TPA: diguanylate cyclase [Bryobacteraceae bacterium]|nr:diguanylate cyclase [Bryobacteraceae bacterium]
MHPVPEEEEQPLVADDTSEPSYNSLEECLVTLLRGIQDHFPGSGIGELEKKLIAKDDPRQVVVSAVELLRKYSSQASENLAQQKNGLSLAAAELAGALESLPALQGNAERWNRVEAEIKAISSSDDLEVVKAKLCADVAVARAEALQERQKIGTKFSGILEKLDSAIGPRTIAESAAPMTDPLTGLPARAFAEAELARLHSQPSECYMALFVVKRLALINARFGYARGDEVLLKVVAHIRELLPEFKTLFRWAPCAFLTVAPSNFSYKDLRSKVQIIEVARMTPVLEWEGRSAMVPVAMDCRLVSAKDFNTSPDLFLRLDTLAADT